MNFIINQMGDSTSTSADTNYYHGSKWSNNGSYNGGVGVCAKCGRSINISAGNYNSSGYYLCSSCYNSYP